MSLILKQSVYIGLLAFVSLLICAASTSLALASDPPAKQPTETQVLAAKLKTAEQATRLAELKNTVYEEELTVQRLAKIRDLKMAKYAEVCKAADIDPDPSVCAVDLETGKVTKRPATK